MKKLEFETSKGRFVVVDTPLDSYDVTLGTHCIGVRTSTEVPTDSNGFYHIYSNGLFFGDININVELIGFVKYITKEQASEIVDRSIHTNLYAHYVENIEVNTYCYKSAIESLHSLLKSKGIHLFENPECHNSFCDNGKIDVGYNEYFYCSVCEEAEEKTFYNPYIFKLL